MLLNSSDASTARKALQSQSKSGFGFPSELLDEIVCKLLATQTMTLAEIRQCGVFVTFSLG